MFGLTHTAESINLRAVSPEAPPNISRKPENRMAWIWMCPGSDHGPHGGTTISTAGENATEAEILADPLCVVCREAKGQ